MRRWANILLLGMLAICALSFWISRPRSTDGAADAAAPGEPADRREARAGPTPLRTVHLAVLNGTGEAGLARRFSRALPTLGCVVVRIGDAPHDSFAATLLVNRRLPERTARSLADALGGVPLLGEWDHRGREDAVLVLGRDHPRLAARLPLGP